MQSTEQPKPLSRKTFACTYCDARAPNPWKIHHATDCVVPETLQATRSDYRVTLLASYVSIIVERAEAS